jgi:hypothetical protein
MNDPIVPYNEAVQIFESLPDLHKYSSFHPYYVFVDAMRNKSLHPKFFIYKEAPFIYYHAFHLSYDEHYDVFDIESPYGYGGPITNNEDKAFLARAHSVYLSWCNQNDILAEFIRFHPLLGNWANYYGNVLNNRDTVYLQLSIKDLLSSYKTRTRSNLRQASQHGLQVYRVQGKDYLDVIIRMYNSTMESKQADSYYFFPKAYFEKLLEWEQTIVFLCKYNAEIVSIGIFLLGSSIMEYHLAATNSIGKEIGASSLVLHEAALYAKTAGCSTFYLGGGTDSDPNNSLLFFKSGFSKLRAPFKIGGKVHNQQLYSAIKEEWEHRHGRTTERFLFYRS